MLLTHTLPTPTQKAEIDLENTNFDITEKVILTAGLCAFFCYVTKQTVCYQSLLCYIQ